MGEIKYFSVSKPLCRLSDPGNPHNLFRRSEPPLSICFTCNGQGVEGRRYYYHCTTCNLEFHRGCHIFPPKISHPFHLLHPLTLIITKPDFDISKIITDFDLSRHSTDWSSSSSESDTDEREISIPRSVGNHVICSYCRRRLLYDEDDDDVAVFYHCSICNFSVHTSCTLNSPPLTIDNLKSHDHTLTLFPRRLPLPCDACGFSLGATMDYVYSCLLCNYMVHRRCIYLPRVIKITRHPHRLSHTSSIVPSGDVLCGVCYKKVDVNYGQYSCNKGCHYAVHSKCATKRKVWDGKDLEGVPEEEEEDVEPFIRIDQETIQHFSHDHHHLKIHGNDNRGNHENKFCQACVLPITVSDRFYSCVQCDFVLHETCAGLPRKKHHPLHKHPLTLFHPFSPNPCELGHDFSSKCSFLCNGCYQKNCGFVYKCREKDCDYQLDARCASLADLSVHIYHDHPLFINFTRGWCLACSNYSYNNLLECIECEYLLCLRCATLPCVAHYKHDKHPLTLCCGEKEGTNLQYWCEICENKLDATRKFYTCNSCTVTLHIKCLLGSEFYMKPNHTIKIGDDKIIIAGNNGNSRPVCNICARRCVDTLVYTWLDSNFCNMYCLSIHESNRLWEKR